MPITRANHIEISYTCRGTGAPVLFISGFSCGGNVWELVEKQLVSDYRLVTFDNRGVGESSAPREAYTIAEMADDATGLLAAIGIDLNDTVVVGHSMGGFIALDLAARSPALAGLVLVSTSAVGGSPVQGMSERAKETLFRTRGPRREIVRGLIDAGFGERAKRELENRLELLEEMLIARPPKAAGHMGQGAAVATFDARDRIERISCACRVVHGTADEMIPMERSEEIVSRIPAARFVSLAGVGHFPHIEAPKALAKVIRDLG